MSKKIETAINRANQAYQSNIFVSQMCSKAPTKRQNNALKLHSELKKDGPSV